MKPIDEKMKYIAVIDVGKTHVKLALIDLELQAEIAVLKTVNQVTKQPPYPHFNIETIWQFLLASFSQLSSQYAIDGITCTAHGGSCVLLDEQGHLALPVLDYEFQEVENSRKEYNQYRPDFQVTGSPVLAGGLNIGLQLFWQMKTFPEEFAQVKTILTYPQYWTFKLTGTLANEITSLGCHTDLWNPHQSVYSDLVKKMGWLKLMPPLRSANEILGTLSSELVQQTGLARKTPVSCGIHDSNASVVPYLMKRQSPLTIVSTGTWVVAMSIGGKAVNLDETKDTLLNVNFLGEVMPSARFMGGREYEMWTADLSGEWTQDDIQKVLQQNLILLPNTVTRKNQWLNDFESTTDSQRYCAICFYLGFMTAVCCELIGGENEIIVDGVFAQNQLILQALSIASQRPVFANQLTSASLGAALLFLKNLPPDPNQSPIEIPLLIQKKLEDYYQYWKSHHS